MERGEVRQPELAIINRAARVASSQPGRRFSGGSTPPARPATRLGEDAEGNTLTVHDFALGVDTLGDPYAELHVAGKVIDYLSF